MGWSSVLQKGVVEFGTGSGEGAMMKENMGRDQGSKPECVDSKPALRNAQHKIAVQMELCSPGVLMSTIFPGVSTPEPTGIEPASNLGGLGAYQTRAGPACGKRFPAGNLLN